MRLVIEFHIGDGCTFSCTETVPLWYESAEAFAVDFEKATLDSYNSGANCGDFVFARREWCSNNHGYHANGKFVYDAPDIYTVDEWFAARNI